MSMAGPVTDSPVIERVRTLVSPIASDLGLDLYDIEQRGGTLRVTLDTPPGSPSGIDLEQLALATRLVSRELDHEDPVPGRYTLEVTSPGLERTLRLPVHFQREVGKVVSVRLSDVTSEHRRLHGVLVAADETTATIRIDGPEGRPVDHPVRYDQVDRARTVFEWGPAPKPGGKQTGSTAGSKAGSKKSGTKKSGNTEKDSS
jgi:ribosome maturation factor RimP